jgi:hypothetical protein
VPSPQRSNPGPVRSAPFPFPAGAFVENAALAGVGQRARWRGRPAAPGADLDPATVHPLPGSPGRRLPRVYRAAVLLDENRALLTLQTLTKASDAQDVRVESTKLKDYDIES